MDSIPQKTFHVYLLIDDLDDTRPDGVFYVGFGRAKRLHMTISEAKRPEFDTNKKAQKIREIWSQGREPRLKVVYVSNSSYKARKREDYLIKKYGHHLTNHQGIHSKYPEYVCYEGYDPDDDILVPIDSPDANKLASAINAAKKIHTKLNSANSKEVMTFLLDIQKQFYPGMVDPEPPTKLAEIARDALVSSDSYLLRRIIMPTMPVSKQNEWLDTLARKTIELTMRTKRDHGHYPGRTEFREIGYKNIDDADATLLVVRLKQAGYIPKKF